jgi:G:T-mismatch repair DNA endonuclease (very short patch repair protein)
MMSGDQAGYVFLKSRILISIGVAARYCLSILPGLIRYMLFERSIRLKIHKCFYHQHSRWQIASVALKTGVKRSCDTGVYRR